MGSRIKEEKTAKAKAKKAEKAAEKARKKEAKRQSRKTKGPQRRLALIWVDWFALVVSLLALGLLLYLRLDWGVKQKVHETVVYNFWNGCYILIAACVLTALNSSSGLWFISKYSVRGIVAVGN